MSIYYQPTDPAKRRSASSPTASTARRRARC